AIAPWELPSYILSQFSTIDEVKKGLNEVAVIGVNAPEMGNQVPPLHYIVHDAQGNSLVIEYTKGGLKTYDNPLGVITNSPTFEWHMINVGNFVGQGTGLLGMPGDFTPQSRFIRAAVFSQGEIPSVTGTDGVFHAFHILNQFDIPKGSVQGKEGQVKM